MLWLALTPSGTNPASSLSPDLPDWSALACWAGRYTPRVSLADGALRLEVAGSLRLFGGLEALLALLREDMQSLSQRFNLAVATTPRAAFWLARGGDERTCVTAAETQAALQRLPLSI